MIKTPHKARALPKAPKEIEEKLIKCPGCDLLLPESSFQEQNQHMVSNHPDIIAERLREAHMYEEAAKYETN